MEDSEKGKAELDTSSISSKSRTSSGGDGRTRPLLDTSGAVIQGSAEARDPSIVLPNQSNDISHFAIDIGGSLIKLVYFSRTADDQTKGFLNFPRVGGRLHFVKFETSKLNDCLAFIESKKLHCYDLLGLEGQEDTVWGYGAGKGATIKATGGGAFKYADLFKERLGVTFDKEDEMGCLVAGANFLLRTIRDEAFMHLEGTKQFVMLDRENVFPYLLVNIGSGVSMIKVDGDGQYERVSGTNVGGGTFWGLGRLLTRCKSFDEMLEMSKQGDNSAVDMLVGDIYGGLDYTKIGLSASTIASSFGKVIAEDKELEQFRPEDMALSLLRMISYNIGQISYLNAKRYGLKRIFFGGFFIRGHAYTMDTMSFAIKFWSKGEMQALFLRHEGFLGALGAFLKYDDGPQLASLSASQFVERFPMGAPYAGGEVHGPPIRGLDEKISWMEKFVRVGTEITAPAPTVAPGPTGLGGFERPLSLASSQRSDSLALNVGVLHLIPSLEVFPLLADPNGYEPNTVDLSDDNEREYWLTILEGHLPNLVATATASEGGTDEAKRRGDAFAHAFRAHLARLRQEPAAYGKLGLANLLEMREECLREFQFTDAYRAVKERENEASLAVLPDLLSELDGMDPETRLLALIEGVLAANIFDWGSHACVELYRSGTILEIYRMSRNKMCRPWRVDDFDRFKARMFGEGKGAPPPPPHKRALLFVDNSGADIVLGMLPLARELIRRGTEVVMVANSLPAINDITAQELPLVVAAAAQHCEILRRAAEAGSAFTSGGGDGTLQQSFACVTFGSSPTHGTNLANVPKSKSGTDLLHLLRESDSQSGSRRGSVTPPKDTDDAMRNSSPGTGSAWLASPPRPIDHGDQVATALPAIPFPRLMIVGSGSGSPCLDLRQVSAEVARLADGADLVVLEGMGRALHTNYNARFKCDTLKLAMIKNQRLAEHLVNGSIYDCVCRYEPASGSSE